ncbi:DUF6456 domain-containing protein [Alsobacter sp. SYSU M60028]|uniref:DUF6456 domain-containing protein n=1 Tax=Alsobacter ponti TaxID=2962936 RepID=A0ABT1L8S3_9HYPH|nr:DUF6456 domain-containing protein [Alsobacter ponti]MCP8937809.1 DUF6456 domain-containing protein [Alsobacter ponti]
MPQSSNRSKSPRPPHSPRPDRLSPRAIALLRALARPTPDLPPSVSEDASGLAELTRAGLAEVDPARADRVRISAAGRARLRRDDARPDERFLAQHRRIGTSTVDVDGEAREVRVDEGESPLAWLRRRRDRSGRPLLDDAAFLAGERFRADLTTAMMTPRMGVDWDKFGGGAMARGGGGPMAASDAALAARQRVARATEAIGGDFAGLLLDVCGFLKGLEVVEREREWPARSAKVVLVMALRRLAEHYGIASEARGPDRSAGLRAWGAPGYRPTETLLRPGEGG